MPAVNYQKEVENAAGFLEAGGVVVCPTDTLYGLASDIYSVTALQRVFAIKGRPPGLALPVLICDWYQVSQVARQVPETACRLAARFWPGPLTLVLPKQDQVPDLVTGAKDTVAVRLPDHPVPLALIRLLGSPITGTSANRSGEPDLLSLEAVEANMGGCVDYIMRSGPTPKGASSTVVDVTSAEPKLIRQGAVGFQEILAELA